jgi:glycosyltransferase involved in cell wall biosynthesis
MIESISKKSPTYATIEDQVRTAPENCPAIVALNIGESRTANFVRELERRGFRVTHFHTRNWSSVFLQLLPFAKTLIRSDFVLCGVVIPFQIPWMILARLLQRPCIVDSPMDITEWPFPTVRHWRWLVRLTLRCAAVVLTIRSRGYLVDKLGLDKRRVKFVESCPDQAQIEESLVATPRFRRRQGAFLICCTGGHPHHRLERFMPIFESLIQLVPGAELLLIADPATQSLIDCNRYAQAAGFSERVHVLPVIKPVQDFYATVAQCDLWVATLGDDTVQGRHEFRMELLEVGLLGKAVVAAATPALIEHGLSSGRELLYIDPSDPRGSALKIAEYVKQPDSLQQLGERLRDRVVQEFSLEKAVDEVLESVALRRDAGLRKS